MNNETPNENNEKSVTATEIVAGVVGVVSAVVLTRSIIKARRETRRLNRINENLGEIKRVLTEQP